MSPDRPQMQNVTPSTRVTIPAAAPSVSGTSASSISSSAGSSVTASSSGLGNDRRGFVSRARMSNSSRPDPMIHRGAQADPLITAGAQANPAVPAGTAYLPQRRVLPGARSPDGQQRTAAPRTRPAASSVSARSAASNEYGDVATTTLASAAIRRNSSPSARVFAVTERNTRSPKSASA